MVRLRRGRPSVPKQRLASPPLAAASGGAVVFCALFTDVMHDVMMICWVNVPCYVALHAMMWLSKVGAPSDKWPFWPECGEHCSAAAVLVSRKMWPLDDGLVW